MIDPNWTFFIQLINFIILFMLLSRFVFKPVQEFMAERERKKREWQEAAQQDVQGTEELKKQYRAMLVEARQEAVQIKTDLVHQAQEAASRLLEEARQDHQRKLFEGKEAIHKEVEAAQALLLKDVDRLADEVTRRLALK